MADIQPAELQGWPHSWYLDGPQGRVLRCPVDGCEEVFINAEEVEHRLEHCSKPQNPDIDFGHRILLAMCEVRACPKCRLIAQPDPYAKPDPYAQPHPYAPPDPYAQPHPYDQTAQPNPYAQAAQPDLYVHTPRKLPGGKTDPDIRALLKHERDVHESEDLSDIKGFIGLIRKYRAENFPFNDLDKALVLWEHLNQYFRRNIERQDEFQDLKEHLGKNRVNVKEGVDWLGKITHTSGKFPGAKNRGTLEKCQKFYPIHPDGFLGKYTPAKEKGEKSGGIGGFAWDIMRAKYAAGDF